MQPTIKSLVFAAVKATPARLWCIYVAHLAIFISCLFYFSGNGFWLTYVKASATALVLGLPGSYLSYRWAKDNTPRYEAAFKKLMS